MKAILSMLVVLMSVSAAKALNAQQIKADLDLIVKNRSAKLTTAQRQQLESEYDTLSAMTDEQLISLKRKTAIQKYASCLLADGAIIVNAVGETMPVVSMGVRETNAQMMGTQEIDGFKVIDAAAAAIQGDRINWGNVFGGGVESILGVTVETLSTYDKAKIEAEIHKAYPGTQLLAVKMKGEASFCGQATLKLDMIKALLAK